MSIEMIEFDYDEHISAHFIFGSPEEKRDLRLVQQTLTKAVSTLSKYRRWKLESFYFHPTRTNSHLTGKL